MAAVQLLYTVKELRVKSSRTDEVKRFAGIVLEGLQKNEEKLLPG